MKIKFVTGGAGTGKSHMLRAMLEADENSYAVVAPTGIAAINVEGMTIHSAFRINPNDGYVSPSIRYSPLMGIETVYVDEASMVSAELFTSMVEACRMLGVQRIICFGDLAQLQPVKGGWFTEAFTPDEVERLTIVYRQSGDKAFADVLNRIRIGEHTADDMDYLNNNSGDSGEGITLAFTNRVVDEINYKNLYALPGEEYSFAGRIEGSISDKDINAPVDLRLKKGAQVIFLNNDIEGRWQNGTRGVVDEISEEHVIINGYSVYEHTWAKRVPSQLNDQRIEELYKWPDQDYARHCIKNGYELKVVGTFEQLPIKLGYASTVHKAQGLTLDKVNILPDGFYTSHGLGYVALSRVTSLEGLTCHRRLSIKDFKLDQKVKLWL